MEHYPSHPNDLDERHHFLSSFSFFFYAKIYTYLSLFHDRHNRINLVCKNNPLVQGHSPPITPVANNPSLLATSQATISRLNDAISTTSKPNGFGELNTTWHTVRHQRGGW